MFGYHILYLRKLQYFFKLYNFRVKVHIYIYTFEFLNIIITQISQI